MDTLNHVACFIIDIFVDGVMSPVAVNVLDKPVIAVVLPCSDIVLYGVVRCIKLSIKLLVYPISEAVVAVKIARLKVSDLNAVIRISFGKAFACEKRFFKNPALFIGNSLV